MNEHYEKYKETIKKVARRNYRKRIILLNDFLIGNSCVRKITKRVGTNNDSRKEIFHLINQSKIVCSNCFIKIDNDLIEFI